MESDPDGLSESIDHGTKKLYEVISVTKNMDPLISYHGDPELKIRRIAVVRAHRKADLLVQKETGNPARGEKGCAVACTVNGYDHLRYAPELGLSPAWAYLEDAVFEGLSVDDSQWWPEAFLTAVPVGKDLWAAYHRVTQRILLEVALPQVRACGEPEPSAANVEAVIRQVADLYEKSARGEIESPTRAYWCAWSAEESAAWSAARSAAESAAYRKIADIIIEEIQREGDTA